MVAAPSTNITQSLAGRSPGIIAKGATGLDNRSTITIRGGGTPLVVIDGVIRSYDDFANILPEDIESMSILKDASATAVYGARAADGIIQVVTRRGKEGVFTLEYDQRYYWSAPTYLPTKLDSYQYATTANLANANSGAAPRFSDVQLQTILDQSNPANFANTDWAKLVLKKYAEQQKHNIRLSGGDEKNRFLLSLGHMDTGSLYRNGTHDMQLTNFRLNDNFWIQNIGLKGEAQIDGYLKKTNHPFTSTSSGYGSVFSHVFQKLPLEPAVNNFGLPLGTTIDNPYVETLSDAGYQKYSAMNINGMLGLEWSVPWVKGLTYRPRFNYRSNLSDNKNFRKDPIQYEWDSTVPIAVAKPRLYKGVTKGYEYTIQNFLGYDTKIGEHSLGFLAGYEINYWFTDHQNLNRVDYNFPIDQINPGPEEGMTNGGWEREGGRAGFVGQVKYNYLNRYFVEGSIRHDASDKFPKDKRWGTFYAGSLGWIISDEAFMRPLKEKHILDLLKFKTSYGEVGQDSGIGQFEYLLSYGLTSNAYIVGDRITQGFSEGAIPSLALTWYTSKQFNIGFDFESLKNRLFGSFEYFYTATTGYLAPPNPLDVGYTAPLGKALPKVKTDSEYRRAGFEMQLGWKDVIGDFKYNASVNMTTFDALWTKHYDESLEAIMNPYRRTSQQTGYYGIGYGNTRFYNSSDDILNSPKRLTSTALTAGDLRYEDFNGDGKIDGQDQTRIGKNGFPRANYGINLGFEYKGLAFNMLWQGATRFDMYMGNTVMGTSAMGAYPLYDFQLDYWRPDNTDAKFPRLINAQSVNGQNNVVGSDFWLINGAYIRLKDFNLSYDFKRVLLKDNYDWLRTLRLHVSGQNVLTISEATKYGLDPENGNSNFFAYPAEKVYSVGINIGF